jgi:hypothetical protein
MQRVAIIVSKERLALSSEGRTGLEADGAEPIRLAENAIFRLPGAVVARISRPRQLASYASPDAAAAARSVSSHRTSAQTSLPRWSPDTPVRTDKPRTISKPRTCSTSWLSSITRGSVGPPLSATATRTMGPYQVISTANQPPRPLAVCWIELLHSSVATVARSSRAGLSGSRDASHRRTMPSWRASPGNTRRHRVPGSNSGGAPGTPVPCSGPLLTATICPP